MPGAGIRQWIGSGVVLLSLVLAFSGHLWQPALSTALLAPPWSAELELWLPFWPFEPFPASTCHGSGGLDGHY